MDAEDGWRLNKEQDYRRYSHFEHRGNGSYPSGSCPLEAVLTLDEIMNT